LAVVLGGVSGSGKSHIGQELARAVGGTFFDGDDFHTPANKEKMSRREPLTDADRIPWLEALADLIRRRLTDNAFTVVACSALKPEYRKILLVDPRVAIVILDVEREELARRLARRKHHFFPPELLDSQLKTLVLPTPDEEGVHVVRAGKTVADVVTRIHHDIIRAS
jgi:carbohydrate kinase (thermoresistant glucokinase family)